MRPDWDEGREEELRCAVWLYETYQAERIRIGEQMRAMLQGRDGRRPAGLAADTGETPIDAAAVLRAVLRGEGAGPAPSLDAAYRRYRLREQESLATAHALIAAHPAWPWVEAVRGVGATLAATLLSRLDVRRAPHASSFWAYCGLGTECGDALRCDACGARLVLASGARAPATHHAPATRAACAARLRRELRGGSDAWDVRIAQRRPTRGARARFDPRARAVCHLVGVSIMRRGGAYKAYYREQRATLAEARPDWSRQRQHLTALRKVEKRFLAHLWVVWRRAAGLPADATGADQRADAIVEPWAMVG